MCGIGLKDPTRLREVLSELGAAVHVGQGNDLRDRAADTFHHPIYAVDRCQDQYVVAHPYPPVHPPVARELG